MAFKLKGMTFGKGTGSESPQKVPGAGMAINLAKNMASGQLQENVKKLSQPKMPAVGTEERKAEYDRRGWAYDDTIPGYGAKTDPTKADEKPPAEQQVPDQPQSQEGYMEESMYQDSMKPESTLDNIQKEEQQGPSQEVGRPDYQKRRQQARLDKRRARGAGTSDTFDIRTDKKEARMKHGRGSKEFKKYKKELKEARKNRRQERRANR